jgi:hypothetical protein
MSSKKHFSPPERQEYFIDIQPPAPVATFVLQRLDRFVPLRSGSCSASKCAPFFQIVRVMAAIFRANVRRAIAGFIPLLSKPW